MPTVLFTFRLGDIARMIIVTWIVAFCGSVWFIFKYFKFQLQKQRIHNLRLLRQETDWSETVPVLLGFFHPYCNAGGGGERVLWTAIRDVQKKYPNVISVVYTGDVDATNEQILQKVKARFNIDLNPRKLAFMYLTKRYLVEDSRYPRFTLLFQSLSSTILAYEALSKCIPDIFFDTMGYGFTYPLVRAFTDCKIAAYVHYPTISSDMLQRVYERREQYNNSRQLSLSTIWSTGKLVYYHIFAKMYGFCGSFAETVMVNSTWTKGHIDRLWHTTANIVYPPCDTHRLGQLPLGKRKTRIVSVAQFRPEKDHLMQLRAMARMLEKYPQWESSSAELVMIGSSRNAGDEERIENLRKESVQLGIQNRVRFEINVSFDDLVSQFSEAKVGLHTMWNEHFGIGVVEYMAAGLIPVAHNSAGPKMDIVVPVNGQATGYLADSVDTFADRLNDALSLSENEYHTMATAGRAAASQKFSEEAFSRRFLDALRPLLSKS